MSYESDQQRALLDEVLAHPEDDVPRLIFADYLEESGDPRGEFIRLQCELSTLPELDERYIDLQHRCDALLHQHGEAWAGELKQDVKKAVFARGFIDSITMLAREFIKNADELYRTTPVNWLRFNYVKGKGSKLAACEALQRVRSLDLAGIKIPEDDLTALLMSPHLKDLRALRLEHYDVVPSESVGATLGTMPSASTLRHLELPAGSTFLRAVGRGGEFPNLKFLAVGSSYNYEDLEGLGELHAPNLSQLKIRGPIKVADTEAIAKLPVSQLEELDMASTRVPAKGLQVLAKQGAFDLVRRLNLAGCGLGIRAANALFAHEHLRHCESLDLANNYELRDDPAKSAQFFERLAGHSPLAQLKQLRISGVNPGNAKRLFQSETFHQLELLELNSSRLGDEDLRALVDSPMAKSLKQLRLVSSDLDPGAIGPLTVPGAFPQLIRLDLDGNYDRMNSINEAITIRLLRSAAFPSLQAVNLDFLVSSGKTLSVMAENSHLPELRQISFCNNKTSRGAIDDVMNSPRLPKLSKLILLGTTGFGRRDKLVADHGHRVKI